MVRINNNKTTKTKSWALALLIPILLSSCSTQTPASVRQRGNYYYGEDGVSKYLIVQPGQTLLQIAVENNVSLKDIARINRISPPYHIYAGQHIKLPTEVYHTVKSGETLFAISSKYQVPFERLAMLNNIYSPYHIKIGQKLRIPNTTREANLNKIEDEEVDPYKNTAEEKTVPVAPITPIEEHDLKEVPQEKQEVHDDAYEEKTFEDLEKQLSLDDSSESEKRSISPNQTKQIQYNHPSIYKSATPLNSEEFTWPIRGDAEIISRYGQKQGKFNEGISIAAPLNSPVAAAGKGEVIYVGNDVEGYGKMVIIRHDGDILSAYAHNSSVLVKKGDKVVKGQDIARVGKTGEVDKPQLYFSLRKGKSTVNPEKSLILNSTNFKS